MLMIVLLVGVIMLGAAPFMLRAYTAVRFADDIYTVRDVPPHRVAIVFGAQVRANGRLSTMLRDRVATGADLYHAGKVDALLLSGDNSTPTYNEPDAMRRYALELGVPDEALILDRLGLRTYDTCYRAREEFGIESAILVTQDFHLDRALLICNGLGIDTVGVYADYHRPNGYSERSIGYSRWREIAATTVAVVDLVRGHKPD